MPQSVMWKSRVSVAQSIPVDSRKLSSFKPESVSSLHRNRCPVSAGMTVQFDPESVSSLGRNMQEERAALLIDDLRVYPRDGQDPVEGLKKAIQNANRRYGK